MTKKIKIVQRILLYILLTKNALCDIIRLKEIDFMFPCF